MDQLASRINPMAELWARPGGMMTESTRPPGTGPNPEPFQIRTFN